LSKTSYVYDADGGRLLRHDPTGTTLYLGGQEIHTDPTGQTAVTTRYSELKMIKKSESTADLLKSVLIELDGSLGGQLMDDIWTLVESGEMGVAFEILCVNLEEESVVVSGRLKAAVEEIGQNLRIDESYWKDIPVGK
jgi:hypothetical protein